MNWKAPPADKSKVWVNPSLEIQLLLACDWACIACDQLSNFKGISWVRKATMTMAQIEHFVEEMILKNAWIGRIRLVGGEPTIHPKFHDIARLLHEHLVGKHIHQLEVVTNGDHADKVEPVKHLLKARVSNEADKQKHHTANLSATPLSLGYEGHICSAPFHCGISLSYYGYAPCSSGAGIMRLRDMIAEHQVMELPVKGVRATWPNIERELCDHCYHALKPEHKQKCGTGQQPGQHELNAPGKEVWGHLSPWLNGKQPEDWLVYGEPRDDARDNALSVSTLPQEPAAAS